MALVKNITSKTATEQAHKPTLVEQGHLTEAQHQALLKQKEDAGIASLAASLSII